MLSLIAQALDRCGIPVPASGAVSNVIISPGDVVVLDVDCRAFGGYHVKCSQYLDLSEEYGAYQLAFQSFPGFVPEPIGYVELGGWSIMIARSVEHRPVRARHIVSPVHFKRRRKLLEFFETSTHARTTSGLQSGHGATIDTLREFSVAVSGIDSAQVRYLRRLAPSDWLTLPEVPQHGDLSLNNLGRTADGIVVFDWEDYGATCLAGFDVCVLAMSISGLRPTFARELHCGRETRHPAVSLARQACALSGVDFAQFRKLVPLYLLMFRYLKRNYAQRSRDIADNLFLSASAASA